MSKKLFTQLFLIFILIVISLLIFFKYFSKTNLETNSKTNAEQTIIDGESLIEDLKYFSTDKQGNEYKLRQKGNIDQKN